MPRQYDYRHYSRTFRLSKEAYDALTAAASPLGTVEIHREHVEDDSAPTIEIDGEKRDHYGTDHLWITDGGDVIRRRETTGNDEDRLESGDEYELFGHTQSPERLLDLVYGEEWNRQGHDDKQYVWFEWCVGEEGDLPDGFIEQLPKHIPRNADLEDLED